MREARKPIRDSFREHLFVGLAWTVAICVGCGSPDPGGPENIVSTTADDPGPRPSDPDVADAADPIHPVVQIETSLGPIVAQLDAEKAPGTVRNFLDYVNDGFYADTIFHYADPDSMVLGGGYATNGSLKPTRLSIRNEAHNGLRNVRGSLAMARDPSVVDSATTQFFINLADAPTLDFVDESTENYGYCVFGEVTDGFDVAARIAQVPTHDRGGDLFQTPIKPVVIKSIRVLR